MYPRQVKVHDLRKSLQRVPLFVVGIVRVEGRGKIDLVGK
jgi:hypothetical protein